MYIFSVNGINDLLQEVSRGILKDGHSEAVDRENATDDMTLELSPAVIEVHNPRSRILLYNNRNNNPFAQLFETIWVMSGSNDIEPLSYFLPRAIDWADNKKQWRAGYGARLRNHVGLDDAQYGRFYDALVKHHSPICHYQTGGLKVVDQINYVVETLEADRSSRRAVMSIWDPAKECTIGKSKDYPCSDWVQFIIRNNKLDCHVHLRSNDLLWGLSNVNLYEWTYIQEVVARVLNIDVGKYYHYATSLHVYNQYIDRIKKIAESTYVNYTGPYFPTLPDALNVYACSEFIKKVSNLASMDTSRFMNSWNENGIKDSEHLTYMAMYIASKKRTGEELKELLEFMFAYVEDTDMKIAARYYFMHSNNKAAKVEDALA